MDQIDFNLSAIFGEGNNKLTATVTIKTDVSGDVSIDGTHVASIQAGVPVQVECGLGQHIIKVSSDKFPNVSKEIIQNVETPGRNYLLVVDDLAPLVAKAEKGAKPGFFASLFGGKSKDGKSHKSSIKLKAYCDTETGNLRKDLEPLEVGSEIPHIKDLADQGDMVAQYVYGMLVWKGVGCPVDAFAAKEYFQKSSDQGYAFAMCSLARMSVNPETAFFDPDLAMKLAYQATKMDCKPAYLILGDAYNVVCQNDEARKWYEIAAQKGSVGACRKLGDIYFWGDGVPKDSEQALAWYEKGARKGSLYCMTQAGFRYAYGDGASQDYDSAIWFFEKPAEANDVNAQWGMGYCYCQKNEPREAYDWLRKAAERGNAYAQFYLGTLYVVLDNGIPNDNKQAFYWLDKSALQGCQDAFNYVKRLRGLFEGYMSPRAMDQYRYGNKRTND